MVEIRDGKKVLVTPVSAEDLADIQIGDIVYLDGDLMTCRDVAHRRLVEGGRELPYDIKGKAIFHAGPIVRPIEGVEDGYEMVSVGPTTSMRMEKFEYLSPVQEAPQFLFCFFLPQIIPPFFGLFALPAESAGSLSGIHPGM